MDNLVILRPDGQYSDLMDDIIVQPNKISSITISRRDVKGSSEGFRDDHPAKRLSNFSHVNILTDGTGQIMLKDMSKEEVEEVGRGGRVERAERVI